MIYIDKYVLNVPLMLAKLTDETFGEYVGYLEKVGARRIFIALDRNWILSDACRDTEKLRRYRQLFEEKGFEVGVWLDGFGFGGPVPKSYRDSTKGIARITSIDGRMCDDAFCPTDEKFRAMYKATLASIVSAGVKLIMLDDDLCLSVRPGIGCACENHMESLSQRLGRTVKREEIRGFFCGEPNAGRQEWLNLMGDTMRDFCREMRACVQEIDKSVRLGYCAGYTSWDIEGADPIELSKLLAGETKPFLRLMGAPYWVTRNRFDGQRLATIIEAVRMQYAWCADAGIEVFSENDSWPRPRYHTPAAYCECFDLALRVEGEKSSLKYMLDYFSSPGYDTGYIKSYMKNKSNREGIAKMFEDKKAVGVRVFEYTHKTKETALPSDYISDYDIMTRVFSPAQCMLTSHAIPTVYAGNAKVGIAFGANAKRIPVKEIPNGMLLDLPAAEILARRGIDTGVRSVSTGFVPSLERFAAYHDVTKLMYGGGRYFRVETDSKAKKLSTFEAEGEEMPAVYTYENADGQRFMVFCIDGYSIHQNSDVFLSYLRGRQVADNLSWLGRENPPATCIGHPGLYMICKKKEKELSIALFNICEDAVSEPMIVLGKSYKTASFLGCNGKLQDAVVAINDEIPPFGFVGITVSE